MSRYEGRCGGHAGKIQGRHVVGEVYLARRDEIDKIFTKSAFLPSDFAKYVRNPRWVLRCVGHLFFCAYK